MTRQIVEQVLGGPITAQVWTGNYEPALPFVPQGFSVGSVLPAVLYMLRWGHRRGKGKFAEAFGSARQKPTISSVASRLSIDPRFRHFDDDLGRAVLGDLLLSYLFENKRRAEGRDQQVQRVFPTHYFCSWIDLPDSVAHLRRVPEMIVALLANQADADIIKAGSDKGLYPVGSRIENNLLLRLFAPGTSVAGPHLTDLRSDRFDEEALVGIDQLLAIRVAQLCGEPPDKARGKGEQSPIPNQRPIAGRAAHIFREDLTDFLKAYGESMPRRSLLPLIESGMAINLTVLMLASIGVLNQWSESGDIAREDNQHPWPLFVDCSLSIDQKIRGYAEQALERARAALPRLATTLMHLRLLDCWVRYESEIRQRHPRSPDGTEWLNLLGAVASGNHAESSDARKTFRKWCRQLVEKLKEEDPENAVIDVLSGADAGQDAGQVLAEALTALMGNDSTTSNLQQFLNSSLMIDEPNGLARRRRGTVRHVEGGRKTADFLSVSLSNSAVEFLVHRLLRRVGDTRKAESLSLPRFLDCLRDRYGFFIDRAPPGLPIPGDILIHNRAFLERRLRDLGLLTGVNDAEKMKRLRPRFEARAEGIVS